MSEVASGVESQARLPAPHPLVLRNFAHDMGVALALFLPRPATLRFSGDARVVALALAAVGVLALLGDYAAVAPTSAHAPHFDRWGPYALLTRLFVEAALLFLVALSSVRTAPAHMLIVQLLVGWLCLKALHLAGLPLLPDERFLGSLWLAVCLLPLARLIYRELGGAPARRALTALAAAAGIWMADSSVPSFKLFHAAPHARPAPLDVERIYVSQPRLLQDALDAVQQSRPGVAETYFVGFAPYAAQNVFENETRHVQALFEDRLGAEGRTALLVNSRRAVDELPLANAHNLRAVLRGFAAKMGAEDTLFLHLTSHGSAAHELAVEFGELRPNDLGAEELGAIVDEAELPWRVIVVAACYSGGFINALRSPQALVITASHAERQSFGCEHGREYTYFGEALYRDSLVDHDYRGAFEKAREIVRERERREGLTPSEPQIWVGEAIAKRSHS